jgi:hypothetical protein
MSLNYHLIPVFWTILFSHAQRLALSESDRGSLLGNLEVSSVMPSIDSAITKFRCQTSFPRQQQGVVYES